MEKWENHRRPFWLFFALIFGLTLIVTLVLVVNAGDLGAPVAQTSAKALPEPYLVRDAHPGVQNSSPFRMARAGNLLLYWAHTNIEGAELWVSDGTEEGTHIVKEIHPTGDSNPDHLTTFGDHVFFSANDDIHGIELWKSDGTVSGTIMVKDISTGTLNGFPSWPIEMDGLLYFTANDQVEGLELWVSDGSEGGTQRISNIRPGIPNTGISIIEVVSHTLFFGADDGSNGRELWKSDGSAGGEVMVRDIYTGTQGSGPQRFASVYNLLFFEATDGVHGRELWRSDGTSEGTYMVRDIYTGTNGSSLIDGLEYATEYKGLLYFGADSGTDGLELWRSDGTREGTFMVKDINPGSGDSEPQFLVEADGILYFRAFTAAAGYELWRSDGTSEGTTMVKDLYPGSNWGEIEDMIAVHNQVFFSGRKEFYGRELWKSDGTEIGTVQVSNINPGQHFASPQYMFDLDGTIFFQAQAEATGFELYALRTQDLSIVKETGGASMAVAGQPVTFTLNIANNGHTKVPGIVITDILSADLVDVGYSSSIGVSTFAGPPYAWRLLELDAGQSESITVFGTYSPTAPEPLILNNGAEIASWQVDDDPDDNFTSLSMPACLPLSNLNLTRYPGGDLFAGNQVQFLVSAYGSKSFEYQWRLDNVLQPDDSSRFDRTFPVAGTFTVKVDIINPCSTASETMIVQVAQPPATQPDLSASFKSVSKANVESGDTLTYTIILRNNSPISATATLTDPIPANTTYEPGTALASDGGTVTITGDVLSWSGQVIMGTPVLIEFAVVAGEAMEDSQIVNSATVNDGFGNNLYFEALSTYRTGYGLVINDDDNWSNTPEVELRYWWDESDNITDVRFSNNSGFTTGPETSAWIPVEAGNPVSPWTLEEAGTATVRRVYAMFRDGMGQGWAVVEDQIHLDVQDPQQPSIQIIPQGVDQLQESQGANLEDDVLVQVTAGDNNSGIDQVHISHELDFGSYNAYEFTGPVDEFPWAMQASGRVYVRVVDRAGNISKPAASIYDLYLPVIIAQ